MTTQAPHQPARPNADQLAARGLHRGARGLRRLPEGVESRPYPFGVRPMGPTIGAEVLVELADLAPSEPADEAVEERWAEVHRALLEFKVLVFRDQDLDGPTQRTVAARWGAAERTPFPPAGRTDHATPSDDDADVPGCMGGWHSDGTWRELPAAVVMLRAVELPTSGGDMLWADMGAAYDGLPSTVRERIAGLRAVHDASFLFDTEVGGASLRDYRDRNPPVDHPVVCVHPGTGRRTLLVNPAFTTHLEGMDPEEGEDLLRLLFRQAEVPEYQCRLTWRAGTVVLWDDRATQHYAVDDYHPQRRVMDRVAIVGDRPA